MFRKTLGLAKLEVRMEELHPTLVAEAAPVKLVLVSPMKLVVVVTSVPMRQVVEVLRLEVQSQRPNCKEVVAMPPVVACTA